MDIMNYAQVYNPQTYKKLFELWDTAWFVAYLNKCLSTKYNNQYLILTMLDIREKLTQWHDKDCVNTTENIWMLFFENKKLINYNKKCFCMTL